MGLTTPAAQRRARLVPSPTRGRKRAALPPEQEITRFTSRRVAATNEAIRNREDSGTALPLRNSPRADALVMDANYRRALDICSFTAPKANTLRPSARSPMLAKKLKAKRKKAEKARRRRRTHTAKLRASVGAQSILEEIGI